MNSRINFKRVFWVIGLIVGFVVLSLVSNFIYNAFMGQSGPIGMEDPEDLGNSEEVDCNVFGVTLHGSITTYIPPKSEGSLMEDTDVVSSENVLYSINQAEKDENVKAILLEVDSYGGSPVAGEEIANALKASTKPTVALIRQAGVSAGYWAATGANKIYASKNSDVGSIGVTQSYLDNVSKNQKDGYDFVSLSVGKYKDMGNPDKVLTEEEKAILFRDLNITHQNFIEAVSVNRGIPIEDVKKIADGSSVLGEKAKSLKLIDEIGSFPEVDKYLLEKIGEKAEICWY